MNPNYHFCSGDSPILISMPHAGIAVPKDIAERFTNKAKILSDTDWHLPILYNMANTLDISTLSSEYSRYVIDLNRPIDDSSLYPGQNVTGLFPINTFDNHPIYLDDHQLDATEMQSRIESYWRPYHNKLSQELKRIHAIHGIAILWEAHSIASHVPRFFSGKLSDLNFGTADMLSCNTSLQEALASTMRNSVHAQQYSHVFNGRFKGGYITRHYGEPHLNIHAVQLEISQCTYMEEKIPYRFNESRACKLRPLLDDLLQTCITWAGHHKTDQE
jgi:N-formylglutamate deformylase